VDFVPINARGSPTTYYIFQLILVGDIQTPVVRLLSLRQTDIRQTDLSLNNSIKDLYPEIS